MNKERLKKLKSLISEAEHLSVEIEELQWFPKEQVVDSVKDYRTGYPHTVAIAGYGSDEWVKLRQRLYEKLGRIQSERMILENWLDDVADPEIRDILRLQYINGLTQEEIAQELGYSVITIKRRLRNFWESQNDTR
jgi:RNA polymerase sigma factor (sigma-70 family)